MAAEANEDHPFDVAKDNDTEVNRMLADTDGAIASMQYTGTIGYHIHVAEGETHPEYLWKIALLEALDTAMFDMMHVGADDVPEARRQVERELKESFDPFTAEFVADEFEDNLRGLIETQREFADEE